MLIKPDFNFRRLFICLFFLLPTLNRIWGLRPQSLPFLEASPAPSGADEQSFCGRVHCEEQGVYLVNNFFHGMAIVYQAIFPTRPPSKASRPHSLGLGLAPFEANE